MIVVESKGFIRMARMAHDAVGYENVEDFWWESQKCAPASIFGLSGGRAPTPHKVAASTKMCTNWCDIWCGGLSCSP